MDIQKKAMLDALEKSLGIVTTAIKLVGIARSTHYKWMNEDEEYAQAVEDINEMAIDFAESKLHKNISDGDNTSIIFYLKCKAKKRGYVERSEVEVDNKNVGNTPVYFVMDERFINDSDGDTTSESSDTRADGEGDASVRQESEGVS